MMPSCIPTAAAKATGTLTGSREALGLLSGIRDGLVAERTSKTPDADAKPAV